MRMYEYLIPPCSPKKMPGLRKPLENAVTGKFEKITRKEVEREIQRYLKGTGTEEQQVRETKALMTFVGSVMLTAESTWRVKRSMLNPCGSIGEFIRFLMLIRSLKILVGL